MATGGDRRGRVRYGRLAAALGSAGVTTLAVAGGLGMLGPAVSTAPADVARPAAATVEKAPTGPGRDRTPDGSDRTAAGTDRTAAGTDRNRADGNAGNGTEAAGQGGAADTAGRGTERQRVAPSRAAARQADTRALRRLERELPEKSGKGRRAVFSQSRQRVWIVSDRDRVLRTYPVSGSVYDNLDPGSYEVWSRSRHAIGIEDSGTMQMFVRFARGDTGAAIGFHDIPVDDGRPVQTVAELGTPLSHGCIRQRRVDARAMWDFARLGTTVVVTA